MILAWTLLAGFGILNARYYKGKFPSKEYCGVELWYLVSFIYEFKKKLQTIYGSYKKESDCIDNSKSSHPVCDEHS